MSVQKEGKQAAPSIEPARIALDVDVKRYAALVEGDTDSAKADAVPVECDSPPVKGQAWRGLGRGVWRSLQGVCRSLLVLTVPMAAWVVWFHPEWMTPFPERSLDWAKLLPAVAIIVPVWLLLLLWRLPKWQVESARKAGAVDPKDRGEPEDTFRRTFAQVVAGIGAAGALYFTFQANEAAKDKQITEQYAKAVE